MAKQATQSETKKGSRRKLLHRLEAAQQAYQRSERKVVKLRVRLERAEGKLTTRAQRLSATQETVAQRAHAKKRGAKTDAGATIITPSEATVPLETADIVTATNGQNGLVTQGASSADLVVPADPTVDGSAASTGKKAAKARGRAR